MVSRALHELEPYRIRDGSTAKHTSFLGECYYIPVEKHKELAMVLYFRFKAHREVPYNEHLKSLRATGDLDPCLVERFRANDVCKFFLDFDLKGTGITVDDVFSYMVSLLNKYSFAPRQGCPMYYRCSSGLGMHVVLPIYCNQQECKKLASVFKKRLWDDGFPEMASCIDESVYTAGLRIMGCAKGKNDDRVYEPPSSLPKKKNVCPKTY